MEKRESFYRWWECKLVQPLWRTATVKVLLKKTKTRAPLYPTILDLDIYPEKTILQKDTFTIILIAALFEIAKTQFRKQPRYPSAEEWMKKTWWIRATEHHSAIRRTLLFDHSVMSDSFVTLWTVAWQAPLSMGFPRHAYWSGLPFPSPWDPPKPWIKSASPVSQVGHLPLSHLGKHYKKNKILPFAAT